MSFQFDRAGKLEALGGGRYAGTVTRDYWIVLGPNGGFLASIALRGAMLALADSGRAPRSMHVRYLSPPKEGSFELLTTVVRAGRSMTTLDVSLLQKGRAFMNAHFCFSTAFSGPSFQDKAPPQAVPFAEAVSISRALPMNERFDSRTAIGGSRAAGSRAETGGYQRFADGRPIDMLALAAMWDTWPPAVFYRAVEPALSGGVPTVESTVYFRRQIPFEGFRADEPVLIHARTGMVHDGFAEEEADIWSLDGKLLVQSRQLALCR